MGLMYDAPPPHLLDMNINKRKGFPVPSPNSHSPDYIVYYVSYICDGSNYFFFAVMRQICQNIFPSPAPLQNLFPHHLQNNDCMAGWGPPCRAPQEAWRSFCGAHGGPAPPPSQDGPGGKIMLYWILVSDTLVIFP